MDRMTKFTNKFTKLFGPHKKIIYRTAKNLSLIYLLLNILKFSNVIWINFYINLNLFFTVVYLFDFFALLVYFRLEREELLNKVIKRLLFLVLPLFLVLRYLRLIPEMVSLRIMAITLLLGLFAVYKGDKPETNYNKVIFSTPKLNSRNLFNFLGVAIIILSLALVIITRSWMLFGHLNLSFLQTLLAKTGNLNKLFGGLFTAWFIAFIVVVITNLKKTSNLKLLQKFRYLSEKISENRYEILFLLVILVLFTFTISQSFFFTSHKADEFAMPQLAATMVKNGVFSLDFKGIPKITINSRFPSGRNYIRGIPYTLSLVLSFKIFGINDFSARFPNILFGLISVLLTYHISKNIFNKYVASMSSAMIAFSGFFITFSTYTRHYMIYYTFFLLSILLYLKYKKNKNSCLFFCFCISLSIFLFTHIQSILLFPFLVIFLVLESYKGFLKGVNLLQISSMLAIFAAPLFLINNFFMTSDEIFKTLFSYHFGAGNWIIALTFVLLGATILIQKEEGVFIIPSYLFPLSIFHYFLVKVGRPPDPRLVGVFFPILTIFISVAIFKFLDVLDKKSFLKKMNNSTHSLTILSSTIILIALLFVPNFVLPFQSYSRSTFSPEGFARHPNTHFRLAYRNIVTPNIKNSKEKIALMGPHGGAVQWYSKINEKTASSKIDPFRITNDKTHLSNWNFRANSQSYSKPDMNDYKVNATYFTLNSAVPVVHNKDKLEEIVGVYQTGYIIISKDYDYRISPETRKYIKNNLTKLSVKKKNLVTVYTWKKSDSNVNENDEITD